ncbi:Rid family hydrolase [Microbacterium sp. A8/3-1]|uniref:Rid family hydrolase n=1 Tax=Microbacterium sp. A8/3-1 TaxID=3160749 RepID=A0AAU7VX62_9MICO
MTTYAAVPGPAHIHPFANVVAGDDLIFLSGVAASGDTVEEQVRSTIDTVRELLADVQSSLAEVVFYRIVVTDRADVDTVNDVMKELLPEPRPACGILIIGQLVEPFLKFELELIAHRGARLVTPAATAE